MTYIYLKSIAVESPFNDEFTETLFRMYSRYIASKDYSQNVIMQNDGFIAGIREVILETNMPTEMLIKENGRHRYSDIDIFDRERRRHTVYSQVTIFQDVYFTPEDFKVEKKKLSGYGAILVGRCREVITVSCNDLKMQFCKSKYIDTEKALKVFASFINASINEDTIRSYINYPYKLVRTHLTGMESKEIDRIFDGDIELISQKENDK